MRAVYGRVTRIGGLVRAERPLIFGSRPLSTRQPSKVYESAAEAVADVPSGSSLLVGGFGLTGVPENLLAALRDKGVDGLTVVSSNVGTSERGLGLLFQSKQIKKVIGSYVGENDLFEKQYLTGEIDVELVPMGTLAERMRAAGAGIPAFYTATGAGTLVQHGLIPVRYAPDGSVDVGSAPRESRVFRDHKGHFREYIMEKALPGDYAIVRAWKGDAEGNLVYRKTSRNHNPAIATAGRITIAEVEELVPNGTIDPDEVHTPGIYVDRIVQGASFEHYIERLTLAGTESPLSESRLRIVKRAALELQNGDYVNLGIGLPTEVSNFVPDGIEIKLQSENGMLGVGPFPEDGKQDSDLVNAGKQTVTALPGASYFSADQSFAMIRGGHCDVTILGSMQVAANGDMANYLIPGKMVKGMGGAMDLVSSQSKVIVTMEHCDKKGNSKVLPQCTLPLTGQKCVSMIITDLAVFEVRKCGNGLTLLEVAPGETIDSIKQKTEAPFTVSDNVKVMGE